MIDIIDMTTQSMQWQAQFFLLFFFENRSFSVILVQALVYLTESRFSVWVESPLVERGLPAYLFPSSLFNVAWL